MQEAQNFWESDELTERLAPLRKAFDSKLFQLNLAKARGAKDALLQAKLSKEISEAKIEMADIVNDSLIRKKIAEANRFVNAKEEYTNNGCLSDNTADPESGPFQFSHLEPPIPVDLKQIESISDPETKKSLKLLHESLCDRAQIMYSKSRKGVSKVCDMDANTEEIVTMLLEAKKMKEELNKDNATII